MTSAEVKFPELLYSRPQAIAEQQDWSLTEVVNAAQRRWISFRDATGKLAEDTSARADELQRVIQIPGWELPR